LERNHLVQLPDHFRADQMLNVLLRALSNTSDVSFLLDLRASSVCQHYTTSAQHKAVSTGRAPPQPEVTNAGGWSRNPEHCATAHQEMCWVCARIKQEHSENSRDLSLKFFKLLCFCFVWSYCSSVLSLNSHLFLCSQTLLQLNAFMWSSSRDIGSNSYFSGTTLC